MSLTTDQITALLAKELERATGAGTTTKSHFARAKQLGPLRWHDMDKTCASKGCRAPTMTSVNGVPFCSVHALEELNAIIAKKIMLIPLDDCNCKSGMYTRGNTHTEDCALYTYELSKNDELL